MSNIHKHICGSSVESQARVIKMSTKVKEEQDPGDTNEPWDGKIVDIQCQNIAEIIIKEENFDGNLICIIAYHR